MLRLMIRLKLGVGTLLLFYLNLTVSTANGWRPDAWAGTAATARPGRSGRATYSEPSM